MAGNESLEEDYSKQLRILLFAIRLRSGSASYRRRALRHLTRYIAAGRYCIGEDQALSCNVGATSARG